VVFPGTIFVPFQVVREPERALSVECHPKISRKVFGYRAFSGARRTPKKARVFLNPGFVTVSFQDNIVDSMMHLCARACFCPI
jgi:hypothetical protein